MAKGKVLIFLDAHCECADGWLNPLLKRINESPKSVVVPLIDVMDPKTFEYQTEGYGFDVISLFFLLNVSNYCFFFSYFCFIYN